MVADEEGREEASMDREELSASGGREGGSGWWIFGSGAIPRKKAGSWLVARGKRGRLSGGGDAGIRWMDGPGLGFHLFI